MDKINIIPIVALTICIFATICVAGVYFDNQYEMGLCTSEFMSVSGITPEDSFANDDYWRYNFGRDVDCIVFWKEDIWMASVKFKLGTLTSEMIENEIYW